MWLVGLVIMTLQIIIIYPKKKTYIILILIFV